MPYDSEGALLYSLAHLTSYSQTEGGWSGSGSTHDTLSTYIQGGAVSVRYKSECPAHHLLSLRLHVLEGIVLATQDGERDW